MACVLVAFAATVVAQSSPAPPLRESVAIDTDPGLNRAFAAAESALAAGKWLAAIQVLEQISDTKGESLVSVGSGRSVNARLYCQILLSRLPAQGLQVYRERVDARAGQWLSEARQARNERLLNRIVARAFASSHGDEAIWLLAEQAWEAGRIEEARRFWKMLLPPQEDVPSIATRAVLRYPDPQHDAASVRARLVLCSVFAGDRHRAQHELAQFKGLHAQAENMLAGRSGRLADILETVIADANGWNLVPRASATSTFAATPQRHGTNPEPESTGAAKWSADLPPESLASTEGRGSIAQPAPLSHFPVADNESVFVSTTYSVLAFKLQNGSPAWPVDADDSAIVYASALAEEGRPIQPVRGTPLYTMTLHDGRLYARLGSPVTRLARHELRTSSEIVGLDVATGQGKLVFRVPVDAMGPPSEGWAFEGAPVCENGRVYVAVTRSRPQVQTGVACFDSDTGQLQWHRRVCTLLRPADDRWNSVSHGLLTLAGGLIFYATDMGAIAALEETGGEIRWIVTYESRQDDAEMRADHLEDSALTPCLYGAGTLVAAPQDARSVMLLDADTGIVLHEVSLPERVRHILGVVQDTVVVSGDSLWGIDAKSRRIEWRVGNDSTDRGYGRGFVTRDSVWWPTRERILVVDAATGTVSRRVELNHSEGETGGNLLVAGGRLLIAQPTRLTAISSLDAKPRESK